MLFISACFHTYRNQKQRAKHGFVQKFVFHIAEENPEMSNIRHIYAFLHIQPLSQNKHSKKTVNSKVPQVAEQLAQVAFAARSSQPPLSKSHKTTPLTLVLGPWETICHYIFRRV